MILKFNPTGTHIHKGFLKVRLDLYPAETDKTYQLHHVYVPVFPPEGYQGKVDEFGAPINQKDYDKWIKSLPHIWKLNPCLCAFVAIPETMKLASVDDFVKQTFNKDTLATLDDILIQPNSAHLISPYMRNRLTLEKRKVETKDWANLVNSINQELSMLTVEIASNGEIKKIEPQSIDVGADATLRDHEGYLYYSPNYYTIVGKDNPANDTGEIDTVEVWFVVTTAGNSVKVGTFSDGGSNFLTCHDDESIGEQVSGSKQTNVGLTLAINIGEYIGSDCRVANDIRYERDIEGFAGYWYATGQFCDATDSWTYSWLDGDAISLYGTGNEAPSGWSNIASLRQGTGEIASGDMANIRMGTGSIAVADIAKVSGVSV